MHFCPREEHRIQHIMIRQIPEDDIMKLSRELLSVLGVVSLMGTTGFMYSNQMQNENTQAVLAHSERKMQRAEHLVSKQKTNEMRPIVAKLHPQSAD